MDVLEQDNGPGQLSDQEAHGINTTVLKSSGEERCKLAAFKALAHGGKGLVDRMATEWWRTLRQRRQLLLETSYAVLVCHTEGCVVRAGIDLVATIYA